MEMYCEDCGAEFSYVYESFIGNHIHQLCEECYRKKLHKEWEESLQDENIS